jgi:hypothetical protein
VIATAEAIWEGVRSLDCRRCHQPIGNASALIQDGEIEHWTCPRMEASHG